MQNRDIYILTILQLVADFATQVANFSLPYIALQIFAGSTLSNGLMMFVHGTPYLLIGRIIGRLIDRTRSSLCLFVSFTVRLLSLLPIIWIIHTNHFLLSANTVVVMGIALFALGTGSAALDISLYSLMTRIIKNENLAKANSRIQFATSVALIVTPGIAALIVSRYNIEGAYIFDFLLTLIGIPLIFLAPEGRAISAKRRDMIARRSSSSFLRELSRYDLLNIAFVISIFKFFVRIGNILFVIAMTNLLSCTPTTIGVLIALTGIGVSVASISGDKIVGYIGLQRTLAISSFGSALSWLLIAAACVVNKHDISVTMVAIANFFFGFSTAVFNSTSATFKQSKSPPSSQAKIHSYFQTLGWSSLLAGSIIGGLGAEFISFSGMFTVVSLGIFIGFVVLVARISSRAVRG
ncbi:MFS transporter [Gluconobacter oxydans]|uniref:Major facilitator transporter n=1 Tax=Gluconobacter thailandicus NBRC 3257 TaxID=1381097 RepID=A0ABQ0J1H7_GLUTH|nr:MFS transporter [Gluconobacter thailandicus]AFW02895.1 hypothetical protein B932_3350 [Gluconobacter oxydans H24]ANQ41687.1 MFS transporter [Gluconobacter oxydans]KXV54976.1 MFS transporter [Gluconobacter thailandicus]GAC89444.1 major facilitator transporter [Gluconobacter thailandicus NBRC 3255]GAD28289.1 major facilitator transporter [Gluconobacter thailandicus NBRC 3257]